MQSLVWTLVAAVCVCLCVSDSTRPTQSPSLTAPKQGLLHPWNEQPLELPENEFKRS